MKKFRAWLKDKNQYIGQEFLDQLFLRMDGRVFWFAYNGFEDVTNRINIEFSFKCGDQEIYEGDVTASGCVVKHGIYCIGDDLLTKAIGFYITDHQCKWGIDPDFGEKIVGTIHDNVELRN